MLKIGQTVYWGMTINSSPVGMPDKLSTMVWHGQVVSFDDETVVVARWQSQYMALSFNAIEFYAINFIGLTEAEAKEKSIAEYHRLQEIIKSGK